MSGFLKYFLPGYPDEARFIAQIDAFKRALSDYKFFGKCLDAGCGEELYSRFLESFEHISEIVNLDIGLSSASLSGNIRYKFVNGSLTHIPFGNNTFDCCFCSEVLEHIKDDLIAIAELKDVIKPGGLLLMSVPLPDAPLIPGHIVRGYTLDGLGALLKKNGFEIKKHSQCFYIFMKILINLWQWQFSVLGKNKRNYFPRFIILLLGHLDKRLKIGKPWDLVILAQKRLNYADA